MFRSWWDVVAENEKPGSSQTTPFQQNKRARPRNFSPLFADYLFENEVPGRPQVRALEYEIDERRLIEAAQRDPLHFAELYEQNFERVYAFVSYRVHDRDQAEDLTAEIFHQALAGIQRFEWRGTPFVAWLLGIAHKVLADRWQHMRKGAEIAVDEIDLAGIDTAVEQRAMLFQLVDSLPEDQRLVLIRRFVDQRSIREISTEMGRSEGAVKQLQFRALQTLRTRTRSKYV
jgi:RNA polymerase sigma-70 factor, ECF subfamily